MKNNLNKENFWNLMMEKYPKAMKVFCDWIDAYKKESGMDKWMREAPEIKARRHPYEVAHASIKFHDLPVEMQLGITCRFFYEQKIDGLDTDDYAKDVAFSLSVLEKNIPEENEIQKALDSYGESTGCNNWEGFVRECIQHPGMVVDKFKEIALPLKNKSNVKFYIALNELKDKTYNPDNWPRNSKDYKNLLDSL